MPQQPRHRPPVPGCKGSGDIEIDVMARQANAAMRLEHGQHHRQPARVPPTTAARRPTNLHQERPGLFLSRQRRQSRGCRGRDSSEGLATSLKPNPVHVNTADLVGRSKSVLDRAQDAELMRAFAFERQDGIDHVLDDAWTGDLTVVGGLAQDHGRAGALGEADQLGRLIRGPASPCQAPIQPSASTWFENEIDKEEGAALCRAPRAASPRCPQRRFSRDFDRRVGKAEPLGAQPHLRHASSPEISRTAR